MSFFRDRRSRLRSTFQIVNDTNEQIAYLRSSVIGLLVRECTRVFWNTSKRYWLALSKGHLSNISPEDPAAAYNHCAEISPEKDIPFAGRPGH